MSNILQQLLASQEDVVKTTAMSDCSYNGVTVKALVGDSIRSREQTESGSEEYDDLMISVYKSDIVSVSLKSDVVIYDGITYIVMSSEDGEAMWHLRLANKKIVERSNERYRR